MLSRPLIRALLIDVSGTLIIGPNPIPGAVQALKHLRSAGIPLRLCSNTSKESTQSLVARLNAQAFGIRNDEQEQSIRELWTSIGAVKHMLKQLGCSRPYLLLSQSAREDLADFLPKDEENVEYDSVVVGLAPSMFTYDNLNAAFRVLAGETDGGRRFAGTSQQGHNNDLSMRRLDFPLIATHKARYIQSDTNDRLSLGPGPFVAALEYGAGVQTHVVGKPTKFFFDMVIDDFGDEVHHREGVVAVIGDDVESDLGEGAVDLGLWRVLGNVNLPKTARIVINIKYHIHLIRTGKYRPGDETRKGVVPPDEVCDSFSSFVEALLGQNKV